MLRSTVERIYTGDRAITEIEIDTWNRLVKLRFDSLGYWGDDVVERSLSNLTELIRGALVLTDVDRFWTEPIGLIPDDYVIDLEIEDRAEGGLLLKVNSGTCNGPVPGSVVIFIECKDAYVEPA